MKKRSVILALTIGIVGVYYANRAKSNVIDLYAEDLFLENVEALSTTGEDGGIPQKECTMPNCFIERDKGSEYHLICDSRTGNRFYKCPKTKKRGITWCLDSHCLEY